MTTRKALLSNSIIEPYLSEAEQAEQLLSFEKKTDSPNRPESGSLGEMLQNVDGLVRWVNTKLPDDCQVKNIGDDFKDYLIYCSLLETIRMDAERKGLSVPEHSDDPFEYCNTHLTARVTTEFRRNKKSLR